MRDQQRTISSARPICSSKGLERESLIVVLRSSIVAYFIYLLLSSSSLFISFSISNSLKFVSRVS